MKKYLFPVFALLVTLPAAAAPLRQPNPIRQHGKVEGMVLDLNKITPMMRQYIDIKNNNKDIIILFRLGDFYEVFFEDAVTVSRELELTLTGRAAGLDERVPMCGVPHHAVNVYIDKLVDRGYKVGICEQLEDPATAKGLVERGLIQIISKGTVTNGESLAENDFNYIGSVLDCNNAYAISYADITTGIIYTTLLSHNSSNLVSEIVSLNLSEVVTNSKLDNSIISILKNQFKIVISIYDEEQTIDEYKYVYEDLTDERLIESTKHLLNYINATQMRSLSHMQKVILKENTQVLKMDIHTKRNLELTETLRLKQRNYSLIWVLDKTKTAMGARLLKTYVENPLINKDEINKRYDVVEILLDEFILHEDLKNISGLFESVQLDKSRTCVFWNDYIDLPSDAIYEYGVVV